MKTLVQFLEGHATQFSENPYMWEKRNGKFQDTTYGELKELIHQFGAGLHKMGLKKGERMALLSEGRALWVVAEMGMFYNGVIDVPLSIQLNEPEDLRFRIKHSGSRMIVVSESQSENIRSIKKDLPAVEKITILDSKEKSENEEIFIGDMMEKEKKELLTKFLP